MLLKEVCKKHLEQQQKLMLRDLISFPIVTRDKFVDTLYGDREDGGPIAPFRIINVYIHQLRKLINKDWEIVRLVNKKYFLRRKRCF